jgi:hypothetical protein
MTAPWDPRPKIRGDVDRRAHPITMQVMAAKRPEKRPSENPDKSHNMQPKIRYDFCGFAQHLFYVVRSYPHFFACQGPQNRAYPIAREFTQCYNH